MRGVVIKKAVIRNFSLFVRIPQPSVLHVPAQTICALDLGDFKVGSASATADWAKPTMGL
jgi:hypothetical protein